VVESGILRLPTTRLPVTVSVVPFQNKYCEADPIANSGTPFTVPSQKPVFPSFGVFMPTWYAAAAAFVVLVDTPFPRSSGANSSDPELLAFAFARS
jgi:hypothetical protein